MGYFSFNIDTSIIIYGAGEKGKEMKGKLKKCGFKVIAFFDQNREIESDIPIYQLGEEPYSNEEKNDKVVIISLSNGMLHSNIAKKLSSKGYSKICFLPMNRYLTNNDVFQMFEYQNILMNSVINPVYNLPDYHQLNLELFSDVDVIIESSDSLYTIWLDVELIFSLNSKNWRGDASKIFIEKEYHDRHISMFSSYISLYQFFECGEGRVDAYLEPLDLASDSAKRKKISERNELFIFFEAQYSRGMDFFILSAPMVEYNQQGYFNLLDGHHRVLFLYTKGIKYVPVKMTEMDYTRWLNESRFEKFKKYVRSRNLLRTIMPIPHPLCINFDYEYKLIGKALISVLFEYLGSKEKFPDSILDVSGFQGYFARNFRRHSQGEIICVENDVKLSGLLFDILNISEIEIQDSYENFRNNKKYDLVVYSTFPYINISNYDYQHQIDACATNSADYFVVEVEDEKVENIITDVMRKYRFNNCEILRTYLVNTRKRTFCIMSR